MKRTPPDEINTNSIMEWLWICCTDAAAGKHAVGCGCERPATCLLSDCTTCKIPNACTAIVKAALERKEYEIADQ